MQQMECMMQPWSVHPIIGGSGPMTSWSEKLDTPYGERISRLIGEFTGHPIGLAPEMPHLGLDAAAGLHGIGHHAGGVSAVSLSGYLLAVEALPKAVRHGMTGTLGTGIGSSVIIPVFALLRRAFTDDCDCDFAAAMEKEEADLSCIRVDLGNPSLDALAKRIRSVIAHVLAYQILLVARGRFDLAEKVAEFTRLMRQGNVPLGLIRDRSLLVLVA